MQLWKCELYDESAYEVKETHIVQADIKPTPEALDKAYLNEDTDCTWLIGMFMPDII